jgi:hypothetical protein
MAAGQEDTMKRLNVVLGLAATAVSLFAVRADAGAKYTYEVSVGVADRYAFGSMGDARNSTDSDQYIGCLLYQTGASSENIAGYCRAYSSGGSYGYCYLPSSAIQGYLKLLATAGSNPYLYFTWDANATCTYLEVQNYSYFRPVTP